MAQPSSPGPSKTFWQKSKTGSKAGFDKLWGWADKLGEPVNKLSNKLGSEAFWPTTLDKESEKAARILRSFCKDGFYEDEVQQKGPDGPRLKQRVVKKIPAEVIKNAKGLAIFTTMRSGLWVSGAGGSGILVGRMADGRWSPPVGILLHTAGLGFLVGIDIYDCVLVLNTQAALDAFSKWRATIGGEISAVAGPVGAGGILDTEVHKLPSPIFTYMKSRGFYAGVQIDGTVILERTDEDERFYGSKLSAKEILSGKAQSRDYELEVLNETLKSAQGDKGVDYKLIPDAPPPADYEVHGENHMFGVPDQEDPDPYGVLALEKQGLAIKEAGTKEVAPVEAFEFKPSVNSPVYDTFRRSTDSNVSGTRSSWRRSNHSVSTLGDRNNYATSSTQTDFDEAGPISPRFGVAFGDVAKGRHTRSIDHQVHARIPEMREDEEYEEADNTTQTTPHIIQLPTMSANPRPVPAIPVSAQAHAKRKSEISRAAAVAEEPLTKGDILGEEDDEDELERQKVKAIRASLESYSLTSPVETKGQDELTPTAVVHPSSASEEADKSISLVDNDDHLDDEDVDESDEDEVVEVHEVQQAASPQFISKARVVAMPKRIPPTLPTRNPSRVATMAAASGDGSTETSVLGAGSQGPSPDNASTASQTPSLRSGERSPAKSAHVSPAVSPLKDEAFSAKSVSIHSSQEARMSFESPPPSSEALHSVSSATEPDDEHHAAQQPQAELKSAKEILDTPHTASTKDAVDEFHAVQTKQEAHEADAAPGHLSADMPGGFPDADEDAFPSSESLAVQHEVEGEGKHSSETARVSLAGLRGQLHDDDDDEPLSPGLSSRSRSHSRGPGEYHHSREDSEDFS